MGAFGKFNYIVKAPNDWMRINADTTIYQGDTHRAHFKWTK
jgi:hypothetical protein